MGVCYHGEPARNPLELRGQKCGRSQSLEQAMMAACASGLFCLLRAYGRLDGASRHSFLLYDARWAGDIWTGGGISSKPCVWRDALLSTLEAVHCVFHHHRIARYKQAGGVQNQTLKSNRLSRHRV